MSGTSSETLRLRTSAIDLSGEWLLTPRWSSVLWPLARFSHGMCPVGEPVTAEQQAAFRSIQQYPTHATGFVDRTGAFVIAPRFALARPFEGELSWVLTETGWAYVDVRGEIVWQAALPR